MLEENLSIITIAVSTLLAVSIILMIVEMFIPSCKVFTIVKPIIFVAVVYVLYFVLDFIIDFDGLLHADWIGIIQDVIPENFGFPICKAPDFVV